MKLARSTRTVILAFSVTAALVVAIAASMFAIKEPPAPQEVTPSVYPDPRVNYQIFDASGMFLVVPGEEGDSTTVHPLPQGTLIAVPEMPSKPA